MRPKVEVRSLNAWFKANHALRNVSLTVPANTVLAIIGPSGCGKTTFVRCLNRMHELVPGACSRATCWWMDRTCMRGASTR